jgi:T-complex protein 11
VYKGPNAHPSSPAFPLRSREFLSGSSNPAVTDPVVPTQALNSLRSWRRTFWLTGMPSGQDWLWRTASSKTAYARRDEWPPEAQDSTSDPEVWAGGTQRRDRASSISNNTQYVEAPHSIYETSPQAQIEKVRSSFQFAHHSLSWNVHSEQASNNNDLLLKVARFIASCDKSSSQLQIEQVDLRPLWRASLKPPVTVESLSVLDIDRLCSYAKLYHDCHFEPEIILRADPKPIAEEYWAVLAVEFSLYLQHNDSSTTYSWLECLTAYPKNALPLRLECLFETLRDITKSLVNEEDVAEVESTIDPCYLVQQVSKGCCDLASLAKSIQDILSPSRSSEMEPVFNHFVDQVHKAVQGEDPCLLAFALEELFTILERMKIVRFISYDSGLLPNVSLGHLPWPHTAQPAQTR